MATLAEEGIASVVKSSPIMIDAASLWGRVPKTHAAQRHHKTLVC